MAPACSSGVAVSRRRGISPSVIAIEHSRHLERSSALPERIAGCQPTDSPVHDFFSWRWAIHDVNDPRLSDCDESCPCHSPAYLYSFSVLAISRQQGQGKHLGGTIKFGGSLAGFVLIFSILFGAFYRLRVDPGVTTPISLAGQWSMELRTSKASIETGVVTIRQRRGDPVPPDGWGGHGRQSDNIHHGGRRDS